MKERPWIPAMGRWRSVSAYRQVLQLFSLHDLAEIVARDLAYEEGMSVLDLGCGLASLARVLARQKPHVQVVGLDADDQMLEHARTPQGDDLASVLGLGQSLPFADASFDRVTATLVLHHLTPWQKTQALQEARRVLRPGGLLFVTDWSKPHGIASLGFLVVRAADGFVQTRDHAAGRLPELIEAAGFRDLTLLRRRDICLGTIAHFRAVKPNPVNGSSSARTQILQQYARERHEDAP